MRDIKFVKTELLICTSEVRGECRQFDEEDLLELGNELKKGGMQSPLVVKKVGEFFDVILGIRRWKAALLAGVIELPVVVEGDANDIEAGDLKDPSEVGENALAALMVLENSKNNYPMPWANKIYAISRLLDAPAAWVYPQLQLIEDLFDGQGHSVPTCEEKEQLKGLRKIYTAFKRKLNKEAKTNDKYLVECGVGYLTIAFKFEGRWYGIAKNPPRPLNGVTRVWVMPVSDSIDPSSI